jgi:hypothetical protein
MSITFQSRRPIPAQSPKCTNPTTEAESGETECSSCNLSYEKHRSVLASNAAESFAVTPQRHSLLMQGGPQYLKGHSLKLLQPAFGSAPALENVSDFSRVRMMQRSKLDRHQSVAVLLISWADDDNSRQDSEDLYTLPLKP